MRGDNFFHAHAARCRASPVVVALFLVGSDRLEGHQNEVAIVVEHRLELLAWAEKKPHDEAFEQAARDVPIRLGGRVTQAEKVVKLRE